MASKYLKVISLILLCNLNSVGQSTQLPLGSNGHEYNKNYISSCLQKIAFPIGGLGAGMFCLEGTGAISHMSVRNNPQIFNEPTIFAAISLRGEKPTSRILEGPVPSWKKFGLPDAGKGAPDKTWGLPRFKEVEFLARFPFAEIKLKDKDIPLEVKITGWSPFIPTDEDNSSLPVGALEYVFKNTSTKAQEFIFSYNASNFMAIRQNPFNYDSTIGDNSIKATKNGFILSQIGTVKKPYNKGDFAIYTDDSTAVINYSWFRGGWFDPITMIWNVIESGKAVSGLPVEKDAPGASLFIPFNLGPGEIKRIRIMMAWYVPDTKLRLGISSNQSTDTTITIDTNNSSLLYHKPWYSSRFSSIQDIVKYWSDEYDSLRQKTTLFSNAFYKSTLPPEVIEAVAANLTILKSPTTLRQYDGRLWGWEGCEDNYGSCEGSCTHVWNYAQALPHLFPNLERSLRNTEFRENQSAFGHQSFRSGLPIRPIAHYFYAAADGQLGGVMKVYRDWRINGDSSWLRNIFPRVKKSLDYCISTWDPRHTGTLEEPHHNTYDIEFWGPEPMCSSIYLGALRAFIYMSKYLGEDVGLYNELLEKGKTTLNNELFNGEYFFQRTKWKGLNAEDPIEASKHSLGGEYSEEAISLLQKEGPKYQYGNGCLSDGVIGEWMSFVCGLPANLDPKKIKSHLFSVYKYNFKKDLTDFSNPQRSTFALGNEGGLILCSWPKGGRLSLPFIYSNEVWTGIEYQVASHLIANNYVNEGLEIVRSCRDRYNGVVRNPFDEYECGHWYARAMASYALLEALTGVRYDAVDKTLFINSKIGDFTSFISTATGFGNVYYKSGKARLDVVYGEIPIKKIIINKN